MVAKSKVEDRSTLQGHRTFRFGPREGAPNGFDTADVTPGILALARKHVAEELRSRGYTPSDTGDLTVRISNGRRTAEKPVSIANAAAEVTTDSQVETTEGSLIVDIFDTQSMERLFHGVASDRVEADHIDDKQVHEAVRRIMANLPASQ